MRKTNQTEYAPAAGKRRRKKKNPVLIALRLIGLFLVLIQFIVSVVFGYSLFKFGMLNATYCIIISAVLLILFIAMLLLQRLKDPVRIIGAILSVLITCGLLYGTGVFTKVEDVIRNVTGKKTQTDVVNVYVLKEDSAQTLEDAKNYIYGTLNAENEETVQKTIDAIKTEIKGDIQTNGYDAVLDLVNALYDGKCKAIILSESYASLLSSGQSESENEAHTNFADKTRVLKSFNIESQIKDERPADENLLDDDQTIVAYVSGIDTTGSVTTKSRSDVNILLVANLKTHQILLLSTPRDYFVPIALSGQPIDKLTHAGLYGIDCSMETLENLYDVNIDHFVRINFTGFTSMIDILGGVEVEIPFNMRTSGADGVYLKKGLQTLNGKQALAFARERQAFADGDFQRGRDQMAIIEALLKKAMSPALLKNYDSLLNELERYIQTNFTPAEISYLVKYQLSEMPSWNIVSADVSGEGAYKIPYSLGYTAWVCIPDTDTVDNAKEKIKDVLEGRTIGEKTDSDENEKETSETEE